MLAAEVARAVQPPLRPTYLMALKAAIQDEPPPFDPRVTIFTARCGRWRYCRPLITNAEREGDGHMVVAFRHAAQRESTESAWGPQSMSETFAIVPVASRISFLVAALTPRVGSALSQVFDEAGFKSRPGSL